MQLYPPNSISLETEGPETPALESLASFEPVVLDPMEQSNNETNDEHTALSYSGSLLEQELSVIPTEHGWIIQVSSPVESGEVLIVVPTDRSKPVRIESDTRSASTMYDWSSLFVSGRYGAAVFVARREIEALEGKPEATSVQMIEALVRLGSSLLRFGQADTAVKSLERALELLTAGADVPHETTVRLLSELGYASYLTRTVDDVGFRETHRHLSQALVHSERHLGKDHAMTAEVLTHLGRVHLAHFDVREASSCLGRALDIVKSKSNSQNMSMAYVLWQKGRLHSIREEEAEAEACFEQSLDIARKSVGNSHPDIAEILSDYADFLVYRAGEVDRAAPLVRQSVEIWKRTIGFDHPVVKQQLLFIDKLLRPKQPNESAIITQSGLLHWPTL